MAITAFTSTAIIDATTIGTTVLTASTEGIAADAIGLGTTDDVTFNSIDSVDGSFSDSLVSKVGGSYKLYNLGTEGDADTEFGVIEWDGTTFEINVLATGTGTARLARYGAGSSYLQINNSNTLQIYRAGSIRCAFGSQNITIYKALLPSASGLDLGSTSKRFDYYGGNIDSTGTITFSALPTSDPASAGQLWNDSGTVKISAG